MNAANTNPSPSEDDLDVAESRLLAAVATGSLVDLRGGDSELDNPARASEWSGNRVVRAEFLAELLTGERMPASGRLRAVKLRGARITGSLGLEARTLICPLLLQDCRLEEPVDLSEVTAPAIRLSGCYLPSLSADQLRTTGNLELNHGFTASGEVHLVGAHIGGQLRMTGARLGNGSGAALTADGLVVEQDMTCRDGFTARGEVRLLGAHIGGQLNMSGASLTNESGEALTADGLTVEQDMVCQADFTACGEIRLIGARIGGQLDMSGASLTNENGQALTADRLTVEQGMFCRDGFTAHGEIRLPGAHILGQLSMSGASLTNERGRTFHADGLTVQRDMFCRDGFTARGEIRLIGARIGGQLDMSGATLATTSGAALSLYSTSADTLFLLLSRSPDGPVDLTNAKVGAFHDDPASWPATVYLRGFVYETLENDQVSVRERLQWLRRNADGYVPQIYDQLAAAYRRTGRDDAARRVAVAKEWRSRHAANPLNWLLYATVGYGYRNWLAGMWLAMLLGVGTMVFSSAHMTAITPHPPAFYPAIYTLDVLLPIVDLGQQSAWQPHGAALYWSWVLIGSGWVLTTAVIAGLAGVLQRR